MKMLAAILLAMLVGNSLAYGVYFEGMSCDANETRFLPGRYFSEAYYDCIDGRRVIKSCRKEYVAEVCPVYSTTSTSPPDTTTSPPDTTTSPPDTTTSPPDTTTSPPETTTNPPATMTSPPETEDRQPETTTHSLGFAIEICYNKLFGCLPHPNHCDRYYQCNLGIGIQKFCPIGFAFDPSMKECVPITKENSCAYALDPQQQSSSVDNKDRQNTVDKDLRRQQLTSCGGQYYNPYCILFDAQSAPTPKPEVAINVYRNIVKENQINIAIY